MNNENPILILGVFVDEFSDKKNIRTAEDRVAVMFQKYGINIITSSSANGKAKRLFETVRVLINERRIFDIAIVPLFGTLPSLLWQEVVTRLLKFYNKKIILGIHGGSIPGQIDAGSKKFFPALKRADILYAPSAYFGSYFKEKGFNVRVIENPVDLSAYSFCRKEKIRPRILWMRAFTDIYNPLMAVRVGKRLAEKYNDFEMVMAGKDGPLMNETKDLVKKYSLENKIIFPGYLTMQQKQEYAQSYDIYICTNRIDNTPVSLTEFMQFGLPVVSVNTGGIPYMIEDGVNGLLVNANDDEAMFNKITVLLSNQLFAQSIIINAKKYVQRYDEKIVMEKWYSLFQDLNT